MNRNAILSPLVIVLCSIIIMGLLISPAYACSVPVFQYALAYWPADPYEVIVFHRGILSSEKQAVMDKLKSASWGSEIHANIVVRDIDLAESPGLIMEKLWESQSSSELPWVVIKYPRISGIVTDVWSGALTNANIEMILDSPIRREVASRILKGETAVWVLLESGNEQQDKAAFDMLEMQLMRMSEELRIVVPEESSEGFTEDDLRVKFSVVKLSRNNPNEAMLIQMLLNSEWDLKMLPKPMAFPIFGRGRALYALVGDGIRGQNIEIACSFLAGWCSCEIKEQNPGVDILMSVNWDSRIDEGLYKQTTQLLNSSREVTVEDTKQSNMRRNILIAVIIQLLVVFAIAFLIIWRRKRKMMEEG